MEKFYTDEEIEALEKRSKELTKFSRADPDSLTAMSEEELRKYYLELQERSQELQEITDKLKTAVAQKEELYRQLKANARKLEGESEAFFEEAFGRSPIDYKLFDDIKAVDGGSVKKKRKGKLRVKR